MGIRELEDLVVTEAEDDWVSFSDVIYLAKFVEKFPAERVVPAAVEATVELLRDNVLMVGQVLDDGLFAPWPGDLSAWSVRIQEAAEDLVRRGELIAPGDVCWLTLVSLPVERVVR